MSLTNEPWIVPKCYFPHLKDPRELFVHAKNDNIHYFGCLKFIVIIYNGYKYVTNNYQIQKFKSENYSLRVLDSTR